MSDIGTSRDSTLSIAERVELRKQEMALVSQSALEVIPVRAEPKYTFTTLEIGESETHEFNSTTEAKVHANRFRGYSRQLYGKRFSVVRSSRILTIQRIEDWPLESIEVVGTVKEVPALPPAKPTPEKEPTFDDFGECVECPECKDSLVYLTKDEDGELSVRCCAVTCSWSVTLPSGIEAPLLKFAARQGSKPPMCAHLNKSDNAYANLMDRCLELEDLALMLYNNGAFPDDSAFKELVRIGRQLANDARHHVEEPLPMVPEKQA